MPARAPAWCLTVAKGLLGREIGPNASTLHVFVPDLTFGAVVDIGDSACSGSGPRFENGCPSDPEL